MVTFAALGAQLTCAGSKSSAAPEPRRVERFQALAAEMSAEAQSLRWKLKIRGIELAILTLESQPVRYSDGVEHLVSTVQSSGVGGWFKTVARRTVTVAVGGVPVSAWAHKQEQDKWWRLYTRFNRNAVSVVVDRDDKSRLVKRATKLGDVILNGETALAALRRWRPAPGEIRTGVSLAETRMWWMHFRSAGNEAIEIDDRQFVAHRIEGELWRLSENGEIERDRQPRKVTLWIDTGPKRLPLRFDADTKFGSVSAELD